MKKFAVTALVMALIIGGWQGVPAQDDPYPMLDAKANAMPKDVAAYLEREMECNHWAGEDPYDKARAREIARAIRQLKCARWEKYDARLREKYKNDTAVIQALDQFYADFHESPESPAQDEDAGEN